jgi:outer membrane protein OmpA-like peptidoglycan-associated protein
MMTISWNARGIVALGCLLAMGCQNSLMDQDRALRAQNVELQSQLDEANRKLRDVPPPAPPVMAEAQPSMPPPAPVAVAPAPAAPVKPDLGSLVVTEDTAAGTTTVSLPGDVFFDSGKNVIKDSAKGSLSKVAVALKKEYSGKPVRIEGYTDSDPILHSHWKSNDELSNARAAAVRDYLVAHGVSAERVTTLGYGDAKPKATKALSRRVEVVVITG